MNEIRASKHVEVGGMRDGTGRTNSASLSLAGPAMLVNEHLARSLRDFDNALALHLPIIIQHSISLGCTAAGTS